MTNPWDILRNLKKKCAWRPGVPFVTRDNDCIYEFEPFRLDPREHLLLKHGQPVAMERAPFDLLCVFVCEAGRLLTREGLLQSVWKDTHVDPNTLNVTVSALRRALSDNPAEHKYIQTVPKAGYRFVAPVTVLQREPPLVSAAHNLRSPRRFPQLGMAGVAVVVASLTAWLIFPAARTSEQSPPASLTSYLGHESSPSVSPDGTRVAFSWFRPGENRDIFVMTIGDQRPRQLTATPDHDDFPSWSPDGQHIAFIRNREENGTILVVDSSGGRERKLTSTRGHTVAWAENGSKLVFDDIEGEEEISALYTLSVNTGLRHRLTSPVAEPGHGDFGPAVSPEGKTVAFTRRLTYDNSDLHIVPINGGQPVQVTSDKRRLAGVTWTPDGRQLIFSSRRGGKFRLWRTAASSLSSPRLVDSVPEEALHPALQQRRGGARPWPLVYERVERDYNIWMIDRQATKRTAYAAAGRISSTAGSEYSPRISPDGQRIALTSDRSGFFELWVCDFPLGKDCARLTSFRGGDVGSPSWSPDGRALVCDARVEGNADIYLIRIDASEPKRLTLEPSVEARPSWSSDGHWVYFRSDRTGRHEIWKTPVGGGDAVQVTTDGGFEAFESSNGANLYLVRSRNGTGLLSRAVHSGSELQIPELSGVTASAWDASSGGIYWLDSTAFWSKYRHYLRLFDARTRAVTTVGEVHAWVIPTATGLSVSKDERYLLWSQLDHDIADLMLVSRFR
jgi:Tol biopolymer transport system component/DNA-binding winged helix-turn-helix (wHTH) protein